MPINSDLKDKITQYTDKIPDDKLLHELYTSQTHSDLAPVIDQYKQMGKSSGEILDLMMQAKEQGASAPQASAPAPLKTIPGQGVPLRTDPNRPVQGTPAELNAMPGYAAPMHGESTISNQTDADAIANQKREGIYQLGKMVQEQGGVGGMAAGLLPAGNAPYLKDLVTRQVPNAVKGAVGKLGYGSKSQAARMLGTDILDPNVSTVMENAGPVFKPSEGLNPTSGEMTGQVQKAQAPLMSERNAMVQNATEGGATVDRKVAEDAIQSKIAEMQRLSPHSTDAINQAKGFLENVQNTWPEKFSPEYAQELKTQLGREIKTWDASIVKDAQGTGTAGAKKAMYPELNKALGATTDNPERYGELNKQYSTLADLFSPGESNAARNQPAQLADQKMSGLPMRSQLLEKARWPLSKIGYQAEKFGKTAQEAPEGLYGATEQAAKQAESAPSGPIPTGISSPRKELPPGSFNPTPNPGIKRPYSEPGPIIEPARQNDTSLLSKVLGPSSVKTGTFPVPTAGTAQTTEPMLLQELFRKVGSGEGVNLSAEEKVMLSKAMKDVNIKVENALSSKARPAVTEHPYERILNANERAKYMK